MNGPSPKYVRQVWYKRRYWVESSHSYIYESSWTRLTEDRVVSVTNINWLLDTQQINVYKVSNVTIILEDLLNRWKVGNPFGIFGTDSVSPVYGYEPYWTKFQVRGGVIKSDGTTEVVNIFTGLATEYVLDTNTGYIQISVSGLDDLLVNADAERVSTSIDDETIGTGDGFQQDFYTANNAVGIVSEVSLNGIAKRAGVDYSISQLNEPNSPAKISFTVAPALSVVIRASYIYWKTTQKFEDLVNALITEAGVGLGDRQVEPVIYPNLIINSRTYQTEAEWESGTLSAIDTITTPNSIKIDYSNASSGLNVTWGQHLSGWNTSNYDVPPYTGGGWTDNSGTNLRHFSTAFGDSYGGAYRGQTGVIGIWKFTIGQHVATYSKYVWFMCSAIGSYNNVYTGMNGYSVALTGFGANLQLAKHNNSSGNPVSNATVLGTYSYGAYGGGPFDITVVRYPSGRMLVYDGATLRIDASDNDYSSSSYCCIYTKDSPIAAGIFGNITWQVPAATMVGTWVSGSLDSGGTPTGWATLLYSQTLAGEIINYYSRSSNDGMSWDAYILVPGSGLIQSTLRRYLQIKIEIISTQRSMSDPSVQSLTMGSTSQSTVISVANFTGMTVYDAITALSQLCNYEFGFTADEIFFFRAKSGSITSVFSMDETSYMLQVKSSMNGYDRVYSSIRATYGNYIKTVSDDGMTWNGPLSRFARNRLEVQGGSLLIPNDADIATGIAASFLGYFRYPRRRWKVGTKFCPQLDLSDITNVSLVDNRPKGWYLGDTSVYLGDESLSLYGDPEQPLSNQTTKVVGMRVDTENWQCELDLEEVLT